MFGLILLTISLILYFNPKYRYLSYFLYLSFMMGYDGGFGLWTSKILHIQNRDIAIIYTFVVNIYLIANRKFYLPKLSLIKSYKVLILFITASVLFSLVYYQFSPFQILQGGRNYLLLASVPIFIQIKRIELEKILRLLIIITVTTSILYILQMILGRPIMPYNGKGHIDPTTGLIRLYNSPANLPFFLTLSFIAPFYFKKKILICRIIFFAALMCTLGRTGIFSGIMMIFLALVISGKFSKIGRYAILICIMFIPFLDTISNRFEKGNTKNDLQLITEGKFAQDYESDSGGTMTYRFAWIYERWDYLIHRPMIEQIFGMGLISESQERTHQMYHFNIGLYNEETRHIDQLSTPDIAYGNLLTKLGFGGLIIYLVFYFQLAMFFFRNRKIHPIFSVCSASTIIMFISSFSGSSFSNPQAFAIYFIFIPIYLHLNKFKQHENNPHRIGIRKSNAFLLRIHSNEKSQSDR